MASLFWAINRTGGATGDLDAIDEDNMLDGDIAIVIDESNLTAYFYTCESANGGAEADPTLIKPDGATSDKRWVLVDIHGEDIIARGTYKAGTVGTTINEFSTDGTMAGNSDDAVPTEKAVKTYSDTEAADIVRTDRINGFFMRPMFEYKDADELYISGGGAWEIASKDVIYYTTSQLTFHLESTGTNASSTDLAGDSDIHYIYIDESTLTGTQVLAATNFINSIDEPAWSDTKQGWYGSAATNTTTSDRCIFAVLDSGVANTQSIWYHIGGREVIYDASWQVLTAEDIDATSTYVDCDARVPIFSREVIVCVLSNYVDTAGSLISKESGANIDGHSVLYLGANNDREVAHFRAYTNASQRFSLTYANGQDTFDVYIQGWNLGKGL